MRNLLLLCCHPCRRICSPRRFILIAITMMLLFMINLFVNSGMDSHSKGIERKQAKHSGKSKVKQYWKSFNKGFSITRPKVIKVATPRPVSDFMIKKDDTTCLQQGTQHIENKKCVCKKGWFEDSCNVPESIHFSNQIQKDFLEFRSKARRIIYAAPFNHEFAMLEAVLNDLYDLVDVFIILEGRSTAFGVRKPTRLLPRLHGGYLKQFHPKIMYLYLDHFPLTGRKKGHVSDSYLRSFLGKKGMPYIRNLHDDDLFLVFDMDEIPSRDSLIFLKVHDKYPEPFGFRFRWSAFGYFWKHRHFSQVPAGCTIGMLRKVFHDDSNLVRDVHHGVIKNRHQDFLEYRQTTLVRPWFIGEVGHFAGWHCSSCFHLEGIRTKFMSAQNADWPRWGSIKEKMDLKNIRRMVRDGIWFDGKPLNNRARAQMAKLENDAFYAPPYFLKNAEKFKYLLENPYLDVDDDEEENEDEEDDKKEDQRDINSKNTSGGILSLAKSLLIVILISTLKRILQ